MSNAAEKYSKSRLRSSNFTVIISVALVLFLLGLVGLIVINANSYFNYLKEKFVVEIFLKDFVDKKSDSELTQMQLEFKDKLDKMDYVNKTKFITKKDAYKVAESEIGPDELKLIDENIFPASIQMTLKSSFVNPNSIETIKNQLANNPLVDEIKYDKQFDVYNSIDKIMIWLIAFAAIFLIIAIVLINNSIRLKIFAKRFIIKTMQLVGARRNFIMKPFMIDAFLLGLYGTIIASLLLIGLWFYVTSLISLPFIVNYGDYSKLFITLLAVGIVITLCSTYFATWRFLRLKMDDLYYS